LVNKPNILKSLRFAPFALFRRTTYFSADAWCLSLISDETPQSKDYQAKNQLESIADNHN